MRIQTQTSCNVAVAPDKRPMTGVPVVAWQPFEQVAMLQTALLPHFVPAKEKISICDKEILWIDNISSVKYKL